nr:immunoglobulin heavy chain junction region [Macaca mulatta]MOX96893.1 immunoglobulin heavy chain junction region [Macaca mulatta]
CTTLGFASTRFDVW